MNGETAVKEANIKRCQTADVCEMLMMSLMATSAVPSVLDAVRLLVVSRLCELRYIFFLKDLNGSVSSSRT